MKFWFLWPLLFSFGSVPGVGQTWEANHQSSMAIFGDSISTGAGTHPNLEYDSLNLWQVIAGQVDISVDESLALPKVLLPGAQEFRGGMEWFLGNYGIMLAQTYLNTEQFSWGYQVGIKIGVDPSDLFVAAENGARIADFPKQLDRLLAVTGNKLPDKMFLFFTANDLCAGFAEQQVARDLRRGLEYLLRVVEPAKPVDVYVVGYLGLVQLITSEAIGNKTVKAHGRMTTCRELREQYFQPQPGDLRPKPDDVVYRMFQMVMPPNPVNICSGLFFDGTSRGDEHITGVANQIRAYRREMAKVVKEMATMANVLREKSHHRHIPRFYWLEEPTGLEFSGEDIAGDCFHLSAVGQKRIADSIIEELAKL